MLALNTTFDVILGIPILVLFFSYGMMFIVYAIKTLKDEEKTLEMKLNELTAGVLYFPAAIIMVLITRLIIIIVISIFIAFGGILLLLITQKIKYNKLKKSNDVEALKERSLESFKEKLSVEYTLERDISRKILHAISPIVILICFLLGRFFNPLQVLGLDNDQFTIFLIVLLGGVFLLLFASTELIRLYKFELMPPKLAGMFAGAMKYHELKSITATTTMILGLVPFLFLPLAILVAIGITSAIADAAASITGKRFGKHKFPKGGKKSVEGYVGGTLTAFLIIFVTCWLNSIFFMPVALWLPKPWNLFQILILALVGALSFLAIDMSNPPIDDNIINPLLIGAMLTITMIFLGLI